MTRETKIGLLVGLAFIIVIGILLSDHINSTTDTARADTIKAADNVREGVATPAVASGTTTVVTPAPVVPREPVRTEIDTPRPADSGRSIVQIAPGGDPSAVSIPRPNASDQTALTQQPDSNVQIAPQVGDAQVNAAPAGQDNAIPHDLMETATSKGVELTTVGGSPTVTRPAPSGQGAGGSNNSAPLPAGAREVKAEPNDSVSRLAARYMGGNTKTNRDLIIKANPSLQARPDLVVVGKSYVIPAVPSAQAGGAPAPQPAPAQHAPAPQAPAAQPAQPGVTNYTVKENDNLWRIAAEQLGSGARWTEIRDLNQDVLKGSEQVHVNMRLKLPAK